jgi:hypothetical protein
MRKSQITSVKITQTDSPLSKGQKTFNSQIQQIEKLRARLAAWDAATTAYQQKYTRELVPLMATGAELQVKLVHTLDRAAAQKELTRTERRKLTELLVDLAGELLMERDDAELKAIYNKHSQSDYDSEEAAELQDMKDMFEGMFGVDLGDDEIDSPDEFMRRAQAQLHEKQTNYHAEQQVRDEQRVKRKKSAKQLEKEERAEADARQINLSIRDIYRKLASALHPDRETDPQERIRKTELMQRINQAYDKQNLLQLLELQIELEHIDRNAIGQLDEERLRHYNAVLKRQTTELKHELMRVESAFCAQFDISPFADVRPETIVRDLDHDIVLVQQENREMERDLLALKEPKGVKAWLKKLRRRRVDDGFGDFPF